MKKLLLLLHFFVLFLPAYGHTTIVYEFSAYSSYDEGDFTKPNSFKLVSNDYITVDSTYYSTADINFISDEYMYALFTVDAVSAGFTMTPSQAISVSDNYSGIYLLYYFNPGSFNHIGSYDSILLDGQRAQLTVTNAVPEPTTILLLGFGMSGLAIYKTHRNRKS